MAKIGSKEWVLDKIRKMLTLAENSEATAGERENAMRMVHRLLAKHNIDMAEARAHGSKSEDRGILSAVYFGRPWARQVSKAIADLFFCEYLYYPATKGKDTRHCFVGLESNTVTASELSRFLVESIMQEGKRKQREQRAGNIYYRSFATGAAATIRRRVDEMIAKSSKEGITEPTDAPGTSTGTALVLASLYRTEVEANKAVIEQAFKKLRSGRNGSSDFDYNGSRDGVEYGSKVSLTRQIEGPQPVPQIEEK